MKKSGAARATKIDAAVKARAVLKTVGNQKDRGHAEVALLKRQAATGKDRATLLAEQIVRNRTPVGGEKLAQAIKDFNLTFAGINGGPNPLTQKRPFTNEG